MSVSWVEEGRGMQVGLAQGDGREEKRGASRLMMMMDGEEAGCTTFIQRDQPRQHTASPSMSVSVGRCGGGMSSTDAPQVNGVEPLPYYSSLAHSFTLLASFSSLVILVFMNETAGAMRGRGIGEKK